MLKSMSKYASSAISIEEASRTILSKVAAAAADIDDSYDDYETTMANWSYQRSPVCDGCFCPVATCPDHPLIRRVVRWVKIIARSKHGMTVVFGFLPLLLGLFLGFCVGRHWGRNETKVNKRQSMIPQWVSRGIQRFASTAAFLNAMMVSLITFFVTAQSIQQSTKVEVPQEASNEEEEGTTETTTGEDERRLKHLKDPSRYRQSGVERKLIPKHIAFIMDGNRRYGKSKYKSVSRGHMDGGYKLRDMVNWCMEECIQEMTVYAFSTENWNRSAAEIDALMSIFCQQCEQLRIESKKLQIVVRVLSTDTDPIPEHVKEKLHQLEEDTKDCEGSLFLNVCLSYGSRGEIVGACRSLAQDCKDGGLQVEAINEQMVESRLLTRRSPPPDIILRTSGEVRISNFLLWQCAYSEFFFLSKHWPDLEKEDLLDVIRNYAHGRKRRFGK